MKPKTKTPSNVISFTAFFQSAALKNRQATVTFLIPPESHDAVIELNKRNVGLALRLDVTEEWNTGEQTPEEELLAQVLAEIEAQG